MTHDPTVAATPHSWWEDGYALIFGSTFIAIGLLFLKAAGLVTGGVAGIALLLSYLVPLPVGVLFSLVNLPFFVFAWFTMGPEFVVKSVLVNAGILALLAVMSHAIGLSFIHPAFAALAGGSLCGMGVLALARHGAGVGGIGVLTLWLQKTRGVNAGRVQVVIDCGILAVAATLVAPDRIAWSALSAVALSGVVIAWHRPGRYTGQ